MKNIISQLFIFIIFINIGLAQNPGIEKWKENIIKNNVKGQIQWNFKYKKNGKLSKDGYKNFQKRFDNKGNIIEENYFRSGDLAQEIKYKYDNKENTIEYENFKTSKNKMLFKQNITYDNNNKKIREERFNGSQYNIIKYIYSDDKKLSKIIKYDKTYDVEQTRIFVYNADLCTITILNCNNDIIGKQINKFDHNNNIIETIEYNNQNKIEKRFIYTFNNKNKIISKTEYAFNNFISTEKYKYDNNNRLVKVLKEQPKGNIFVNNIYKYNMNNYLVEEQWSDDNSTSYSTKKYFYNKHNLVERTEVFYALYNYRIVYKYKYNY